MSSISTATWIRKNMLGYYSEQLQRPLTEAEIRVKESLERMELPDWYLENARRKPLKLLKNSAPIESRPALWKTIKPKKSAISNPQQHQENNERDAKKPEKFETVKEIYVEEPKYESFEDSLHHEEFPEKLPMITGVTRKIHLNIVNSSTYPRVTQTKKQENINLPLESSEDTAVPLKLDQADISLVPQQCVVEEKEKEVEEKVEKSDYVEFCPKRARSPYSNFLSAPNKSTQLEKIVQNKKYMRRSPNTSFVRQMVKVLEENLDFSSGSSENDSENDSRSENESRNNSIGSSSCTSKSGSDCECSCSSDEENVHWIPLKKFNIPRSSSKHYLTMSRNSAPFSPNLSPIQDSPVNWVNGVNRRKSNQHKVHFVDETLNEKKQEFRDSGYSDNIGELFSNMSVSSKSSKNSSFFCRNQKYLHTKSGARITSYYV